MKTTMMKMRTKTTRKMRTRRTMMRMEALSR